MTEYTDSLATSPLCRNCCVLSFNDGEIGGIESHASNGQSFLDFPENLKGPRMYKAVRLEYDTSDVLPDLQHLQKSAEAGCAFCCALRSAVQDRGWSEPAVIKFDLRYIWCASDRLLDWGLQALLVDLRICSDGMEVFQVRDTLLFQIDCSQGKCMSWLRTKESPYESALCEQNIAWLKQELDRCTDHGCVAPLSNFTPGRLIEVGTDNRDCLRLVSSPYTLTTGNLQYATLSYCWGDAQDAAHQLRTTSMNLEQHCITIVFSHLTRLAQDAIKVTRALSIRYLWIDALCIVQDDVRDWTMESARMGQIYENSHITICVPTASSCIEGFLQRPSPITFPFQSRVRPDVNGTLSLRLQSVKDDIGYGEDADIFPAYLDIMRGGPWSSRAWTYQEEQLSMRRVYFGCSNIHFDCRQRMISEPADRYISRHFGCARESIDECRQIQDKYRLYNVWDDMVHHYVCRSATDIMDMFPALSGLASTMATEVDDTYVAGLWMKDLPRGLLWASRESVEDWPQFLNRMMSNSQQTYIGPSWSWASVYHGYECPRIFAGAEGESMETNVLFRSFETNFRSACQSLTAWTIPYSLNLNPFGRIKHGELHALAKVRVGPSIWTRCPLKRFPVFKRWIARLDDMTVSCAIDFEVADDHPSVVIQNTRMLLLASSLGNSMHWPEKDFKRISLDSGTASAASTGDARSTDCAADAPATLGTSDVDQNNPTDRNAWGLLIHPTRNDNEYFRIGVFRIAAQDGGLRHFEHLPDAFVKVI